MNNNQQQQRFQQNMQAGPGSGLTRYRSTPSSYFASLFETHAKDSVFGGDELEHLFNSRDSGPERILSRFMSSTDTVRENFKAANAGRSSKFPLPGKAEIHQPPHQSLQRQASNNYSSAYQVMYRGQNPGSGSSGGASENSYGGLLGSYNVNQMKMESAAGDNRGLIRHSSSPAGIFANIDMENETSSSSTNRFKYQMDFSSRYSSSETMMNTIPENDLKGMGENIVANRHFSQNSGNNIDWDDSDSFLQNESKRFSTANASDDQNNEGGNRSGLSHHLSLPTSSAMETMLQDRVPCKMRAKRGFATHPRSIAERVRRTKISERMRKLQELLPNMEKQINTSDILDLAVDYIKNLQRQAKTLSDDRARCSCPAKHNL